MVIKTHHHMLNCPLAIYRVNWKEGGHSVAAIGYKSDGTRWFAPTNWLLQTQVALLEDHLEDIESLELIAQQRDEDELFDPFGDGRDNVVYDRHDFSESTE